MVLVLFDIDGTLIRTRGAGREALDAAFRAVHGWEDATESVHIAGSTDAAILRDVHRRFGGAPLDAAAVKARYLAELEARLADPRRIEVCPGVTAALDALAGRAEVALLTGNWEDGARLKLGACGLWERFAWGAWGDDAADRNELLPIARARARERGIVVDAAVIIGDTRADIACARADGGHVVVVETGFDDPDLLAKDAPDLQLPDLDRGLPWLLALVDGLSRGGPR